MRIAILTAGTRGDVQPCVALGAGLKEAGHDVVLAAHEPFHDLVTAAGLEFAVMPGGFTEEELELHENRESLFRLRMLATLDICTDADAIAYTTLAVSAYHVAERLRLPPIRLLFEPAVMTGGFPSVYARAPRTFGSLHNRLTHVIEKLSHWAVLWRPVNRLRAEILDLPAVPPWGPFIGMHRKRVPTLLGVSPTLVPRPDDWPPWVQITGYWFLDEPGDWKPPSDLEHFLAEGPTPVFLEAGSFTRDVWRRIMRLAVEELVAAGCRVVTAWEDGSLADGVRPDAVFVMDRHTPHYWILPRTRAVVAHGGAGTTHAIARAGLPTMTISVFTSHLYWGRRLHAAGMAPRPLPFQRVTREKIARGIDELLTRESYAERAAEVGAALRAEDGVTRAVDEIERMVTGRSTDHRGRSPPP